MIRTISRSAAYMAAALALAVCAQVGQPRAVLAQASEAYALVEAVNAYRESLGLARLPVSDALMAAAQRHAEWMAANYSYSHAGAGGSMPQDRATAAGYGGTVMENIAGGTNATIAWVVNFWDQTYIHQVAMRNPAATHLGAGFAVNDQQRLFVLLVGAAGAPPPSAPQPAANEPPAAPQPAGSSDSGQSQPSVQAARVAALDSIRLAEPAEDGSIVHSVEAGQTVWAIAMRYGVDPNEILALNRLTEHSILQPGDRLIIRLGEGQAPPEPTAPTTYIVQANDSLWSIAARTGTTVEDLLAWNELTEQDIIQPGDELIIVPPTPVPTEQPTATPSSTPSATPTPAPTATPTGEAPAVLPPVTEVAQVATDAPAMREETAAPGQQNLRLYAVVAFGGMAVVMAAMLGVAGWLALAKRRNAGM
ncbi:MAG: LysM peptidoglycan-binding domain-containing protein [Chloroflexota bacterium]|nr:MAG: hypothetical protein DIU68_15670 [Chloroflexota bacterium]